MFRHTVALYRGDVNSLTSGAWSAEGFDQVLDVDSDWETSSETPGGGEVFSASQCPVAPRPLQSGSECPEFLAPDSSHFVVEDFLLTDRTGSVCWHKLRCTCGEEVRTDFFHPYATHSPLISRAAVRICVPRTTSRYAAHEMYLVECSQACTRDHVVQVRSHTEVAVLSILRVLPNCTLPSHAPADGGAE
jgi:hypothetical protein